MAREMRKEADLIFMPYNYVLDVKVMFVLLHDYSAHHKEV